MDNSRITFVTPNRSVASLSSVLAAPRKEYPTTADAYELVEECGKGVSATVWRAVVKATGEEVAIKNLDLENLNCSMDEIVREAHTMRSLNHPNLLPLYCSFVHENNLWMVMPYIHGGSVLNIMRFKYPDGLEEPAIATIMKSVLKALDYLHKNGIIHRDIKAGNVLLDWDGHVMLADFGVAAQLERGGSWGNRLLSRNTFVGTPCWMAPEVMEPERGYDWRADIWSFGITLLELAHGHAPFARLPPMKVLMMTLNNPPPTLDQSPDSKKHFSKAMRDIVAKCLVKSPADRPTAAQLLEHKFFKTAHDAHYLHRHVLEGLPPVPQRVEMMKQAHGGGQKAEQEKEILASQQEYRRGMSNWNFDVDALKAAAAAAAAREEQERLETIKEGRTKDSEGTEMNGSRQGEGIESPTKSPVAFLVEQASQGSSLAKMVSQKSSIKEHGRFKIYEGDEPPPFSPHTNDGASLMEEAMSHKAATSAASSTVDDLDQEGKDGKEPRRKGRFVYVEEEDGKTRLTKTLSSIPSERGPPPSSGQPGIGVLHSALKDLLESAQQQHESLREMTAAIADAEKGKLGALNAYLSQRHRFHSSVEVEKLQQEIAELKEENARLKEQLQMTQQ